jgi:hypothetical protein
MYFIESGSVPALHEIGHYGLQVVLKLLTVRQSIDQLSSAQSEEQYLVPCALVLLRVIPASLCQFYSDTRLKRLLSPLQAAREKKYFPGVQLLYVQVKNPPTWSPVHLEMFLNHSYQISP